MSDVPDPPPGLWDRIDSLLRHERELWESGIDTPPWWTAATGAGEDTSAGDVADT